MYACTHAHIRTISLSTILPVKLELVLQMYHLSLAGRRSGGAHHYDQSLLLLLGVVMLFHHAADESDESEQERACGTTATVCLVRQDRVVVANVGDSRAVLCRNGTAVDLSTEHRSAYLCLTPKRQNLPLALYVVAGDVQIVSAMYC